MPITTSHSVSRPAAAFVKMEERKRGALEDLAPPTKRQAVNGAGRSRDDSGDMKEEAWIEEYQKGAIYRQMLEYKREKVSLESRLQEVERKSTDRDDHIRAVNAWLLQLLQEIELLAQSFISTPSMSDLITSSGLSDDSNNFQKHLGKTVEELKPKAERLLRRLAEARGQIQPDAAQLEEQVKSLLASQKELGIKLQRLESENTSLSEQLDEATLKVIKAERKLDRHKSAQVSKLEQQALASATRPFNADENNENSGELDGNSLELRLQYQEAIAVASKQQEQLESMHSEIRTLQEENTLLKIKKETMSEEEYVRTDVFKQFRAQNEDLIKRINNLEAANRQLREDAEKLQAERTSFQSRLENEAEDVTKDCEDQIAQKDQDLARIRSARDQLHADLEQAKRSLQQERTAMVHIKELLEAKDDRISGMESELERLRPAEDTAMAEPREDLEALSAEDLRQRYIKLEKDFEAINKEMPLLEKSYKKSMGLAHKKVMDFQALEERVAVLISEKNKADQKYFSTCKVMEVRRDEVKVLRMQNSKSSEIISQLKDLEIHNRSLVSTLEKQITDLRQSNSSIVADNKKLDMASAEATRKADFVRKEATDLQNQIKASQAAAVAAKEQAMAHEIEAEKLKVRLKEESKSCQKWKQKCQNSATEEEEMLRNLVLCSVCRSNFKNTMLRGCGHLFCDVCVENRLANRMRKCPSCNKSFDRSDATHIHL